MGASKRYLLATILLLAPAAAAAEGSNVSETDVLDAANQHFLTSIADLSTTIESCGKAAEGRAPKLKKSQLEKLQPAREELLIGLSHLSFQNMFQCEQNARLKAAYASGILIKAMNEAKADSSDVESVQQSMIYNPIEHIRYQLRYSRLDPGLRRVLEKAVGNRPFDIIKTLEVNGLMLE